jgi:type I restriction enzyme, R subunit
VYDPVMELVSRIDHAVKEARPDGWRGVRAKEQVIKKAIFELLHDDPQVERIFLLITQHPAEY